MSSARRSYRYLLRKYTRWRRPWGGLLYCLDEWRASRGRL